MPQDMTPQAVLLDDGSIVASLDRFTFTYANDGRSFDLNVEPLDTYYFRLPANPAWSDGSAITADDARTLQRDLATAFAHWNIPIEFVLPGDPRILSSANAVADWIRLNARETGS